MMISNTVSSFDKSATDDSALASGNEAVADCHILPVAQIEVDQPPYQAIWRLQPRAKSQPSNDTNFRSNVEIGSSLTLHLDSGPKYLPRLAQTDSLQLSPSIYSINISGSGCDNVDKGNKGSPNSSCGLGKSEAFTKLFLKGKIGYVVKYALTYPLIILCLWSLLYIFWGDMAFPGGALFALITLEVSAIFLGEVSSRLFLSPFTGMLCSGLLFRNMPWINVAKDLSSAIASPLRGIAIVILLTRGAFGVNMENIRKFKNVVPSLAIGSCVIEAIFGSLSAYFIIGFSPAWAALIGSITSAMSGAGVLPYLLRIETKINDNDTGESVANARETLVIAKTACGLDAVVAIFFTECSLGFIFADEELVAGLTKGLAEVAMGIVFGILWGGISGILLSQKSNPNLKIVAIFSGGAMSLIGLYKIGYPRGGPLGVFSLSLVAVNIWRWKKASLTKLTSAFDMLWFIFQPLLFGIIGARTDFGIVDWVVIYKGCICLVIGMTGRVIGSFLMTSWSDLPLRKRIFLVVSWMGKGTLQAALGPVALDTAIDLGLESKQMLGYQIMNLATMTVLLSSIFGFLTLRFFGHRILTVR